MLTPELIDNAVRVVTMGCGIETLCPATFLPTEDWGLEDPVGQQTEKIREIRDQIKAKIEQLLETCKNMEVHIVENTTDS